VQDGGVGNPGEATDASPGAVTAGDTATATAAPADADADAAADDDDDAGGAVGATADAADAAESAAAAYHASAVALHIKSILAGASQRAVQFSFGGCRCCQDENEDAATWCRAKIAEREREEGREKREKQEKQEKREKLEKQEKQEKQEKPEGTSSHG
jgi:3'-phosphoadenosine 5'-phosphosulfate sulfotransferase (PAPS reductase)/FAD synthetase